MIRPRRLAALFVLSLTAAVSAHETWLAPNQGYIAPGLSVRIDMTSGGAFPILDTPIEESRIAKVGIRLGDKTLTPVITPGSRSLKLSLKTTKDAKGYATAFASLKSRKLTLTADTVAEYLEEIGQTARFLDAWKARPEPRTWREEYSKHMKAFFRVGNPTDTSWKNPAGLALEIVPLSDPTRSRAAAPFAVQVLKAGQPYPNFTLVALFDTQTPRVFMTTDASGQASFSLDRPGRWLIEGTDLRESTKPGLDFESDFTTLLVTVVPVR